MATPETAEEPSIVETLNDVTPEVVADFQRLLPQLTGRPAPDANIVEAYLLAATNPGNEDSRVVVIRDDRGHVQATATGTICRIPSGNKTWVDDVITDESCRGRGYGEKVIKCLHDWFTERGVESVNLTSNASHAAAGRLYERVGYYERVTRVYRKRLGGTALTGEPEAGRVTEPGGV